MDGIKRIFTVRNIEEKVCACDMVGRKNSATGI